MSLAVQVLSDKGKGLGLQPSPYDIGFALMEAVTGWRDVKFDLGAGGLELLRGYCRVLGLAAIIAVS